MTQLMFLKYFYEGDNFLLVGQIKSILFAIDYKEKKYIFFYILKYLNDHRFSFCDLAGSERLKKTLNIGDRLKEAQNINTSLLVLGRCLKSIHEGQLTRMKTDAIGPFRESKLTRLFQRALSGKEHFALIVNVNPLPNLYAETQNVLNFAAIAKKIIIEKKKQIQKKLKSRFSQIITQNIQKVIDWDSAELESVNWQDTDNAEEIVSEYATSEEYLDLVNENEKLKQEIATLKNSALIQDFQSRQEMADKYIAMINALEIDWKQRINDVETQHEDALEWSVKQVEDFYKKKLNQLRKNKRSRSDYNDEGNDLDLTLEELGKENAQLREKNESLKKVLTEFKVTNETLTVEKNKACFELGLSKEDLKVAKNLLEAAQKDICFNLEGKNYIEKMAAQLLAKDDQIKKLKEFLNEAKEEYITITHDIKKKELCIDEQAKIIIENEDKIEDLESHLEQVNICLTEKTRIVELLEERFESQNEKLSNAEDKILQLQKEIDQLKKEKSLKFHLEQLEPSEISVQDEYQEIIVKEELIIDNVADLNNVIENIQEETNAKISTNKTDKNESTDSNSIEETSSKTNSKVLQTLPSNIACSKTFVETSCQTNVTNNENCDKVEKDTQTTVTITGDIQTDCNKTPLLKEEAVQTVEIIDDDAKILKELSIQYNDIQTQHEQECLKVKKLTDDLYDIKKTVQSLKEKDYSNKVIINEYIHSKEVLQKQLSLITEEKQKVEETLLSSNKASEQKIADYKHEIDKLEKNLSVAQNNAQEYLEKLETIRKEFDNYILKCKQEKEVKTYKQDEFVSVKEDNNINKINLKQLDKHAEDVLQLEKDLETIVKLKEEIVQLNKNLEICQMEKNCTQKALNENNKRLLELENRLDDITLKEQEKDTEIMTLQKELKRMIQRNENTEIMEAELKSTINELTQTRETLSQKEQYVKELNIRLENFERNAKILSLLEENAKERQQENERLRNTNDELRNNLTQREREMDAFMKNRNETMTKYENLVKNQQEELERQKREVTRFQELFRNPATPTPNKDEYNKLQNRIELLQNRLKKYETSSINAKAKGDDTASEDEISTQRQPKRRGKKVVKQEDIPVIELSGSESKRSTRRTALPPPETLVQKKSSRKKKLFQENESFTDIEPSPLPVTRNLRNRKK